MSNWTPIRELELRDKIQRTETELRGDLWNFWQLIRISPEKWSESEFGSEGGGFWVVAICGRKVLWYNDIEDGFNVSSYTTYGEIDGYYCEQDELNIAVANLYLSK